ncbi:hypothetical protein R1flu_013563 [Riccia fluitans]|uniref:Uncharacterized protein n=1 Tax=Riccia fluitans TaxID=41844 RepID=A0ABD1YDR6_9MARC
MDTTEGGALVEDDRSSRIGERQGSQPRMRGATQTLLPFSDVAQPLERPNFTGLGVSEAKKRLVDQSVGAEFFLQHRKKLSRASREPVDEEEAMVQAWWEGAREPGEPIGTKQDRTEGTNSTSVVRDSPSSVATATTPLEGGPATSQSR